MPAALQDWSACKIRNRALMPVDRTRVHLTPNPGVTGSDFINASWMMGKSSLTHKKHYLLASVLFLNIFK